MNYIGEPIKMHIQKPRMQSSMGRACTEAIRIGKCGRTAVGKMNIKEPWDSSRCKLGKLIHDGGREADRLWAICNPTSGLSIRKQKRKKLCVTERSEATSK
jgi:hypothetical protein